MTNENPEPILASASTANAYLKTYVVAPGFRVSIDRSNAVTPDPAFPFLLSIRLERVQGMEYTTTTEYADADERDSLYHAFDQVRAEAFYKTNLPLLNMMMDEF